MYCPYLDSDCYCCLIKDTCFPPNELNKCEKYLEQRKKMNKINKETQVFKISNKTTMEFSEKINKNICDLIEQYYRLGEANIISFILNCFYEDKYKSKDIKEYIKAIIDSDNELKEMVYDCMKDW